MDKNLLNIDENTSSTICVLPFLGLYGTANGTIVSCCEAQETPLINNDESFYDGWNNERYTKLRKDLITGKRPSLCEKCWKNEDEGLKSNRQQMLEDFNKGFFGEAQLISNPSGVVDQPPRFLELKPSNICNLKCRMCHPESSHRIYEDKEIISQYRSLPWQSTPLKATKLLNELKENKNNSMKNLRVLQYSGGEPLISREQFEFTNFIADNFGHNIHLRYSTNLNNLKFEQYDVINLWKKFKKVNVKVSVDGINDVYDYIRVGGEFNTLVKNIDILQNSKLDNIDLAFGFTTQVYNMFQLPEFLDFFTNIIDVKRITTYLLYTPNFMCIENYPPEIKNKIIKKLDESKWDFSDKIDFLKNSMHTEGQDMKWKKLLRYTKALEDKSSSKHRFQDLLNKYL